MYTIKVFLRFCGLLIDIYLSISEYCHSNDILYVTDRRLSVCKRSIMLSAYKKKSTFFSCHLGTFFSLARVEHHAKTISRNDYFLREKGREREIQNEEKKMRKKKKRSTALLIILL